MSSSRHITPKIFGVLSNSTRKHRDELFFTPLGLFDPKVSLIDKLSEQQNQLTSQLTMSLIGL